MKTIKEIQDIQKRASKILFDRREIEELTLDAIGLAEETGLLCKELIEARKDQNRLNALDWAGVDNWDGYSYAMELLEEHKRKHES